MSFEKRVDRRRDLAHAHYAELLELAELACNQQLTEPTRARLSELLDGDEVLQRLFCDYMAQHAELHWSLNYLSGLTTSADSRPIATPIQNPWGFLPNLGTWTLLTLFGLAFGLGLGWNWRAASSAGKRIADESAAEVAADSMAAVRGPALGRISGTLNCRWDEQVVRSGGLGFRSLLYKGERLKLLEGLAEITFNTGVRVILEAPAELDVSELNESVLRLGRMTASVPDGAEGFRVTMNGLTLVDQGTEFGVSIDDQGRYQVHVFDGLVEGHFGDEWGEQNRLVRWGSNTAVSIDSQALSIDSLSVDDAVFVRTMAPPTGPAGGLLAKEDFEYPPAPMNAQNGGFGWGEAWSVMSAEGDALMTNRVEDGSLRYNGLVNSGNHAKIDGNFNRVRRVLGTSIGGVFDTANLIEDQDGARLIGRDGSSVYISFTQKINAIDEQFYGFELHRGDGNRNRVLCIGHGAHRSWFDGPPRTPAKEKGVTGWAVTSEYNGPDPNTLQHYGDLGSETTDVVLIVLKISFGPENVDRLEVFVNPPDLIDPSRCRPQVVGVGNFAFDRIGLANFDGIKAYSVDHIRVGKSYASVTQPHWDGLRIVQNLATPTGN